MKPALSQVCSLEAPFETDVEDYAAGKCEAIELWLGKLDAYLEKHSPDDVRRLLAEHDVTAPVASFQGGLLTSQGEFRKQHWEAFEQRLALCRELGIGTLVVAADVARPARAAGSRSRAGVARPGRRAGRASTACGWHSSFRPARRSSTTCKPPRRWSPKSAARTWASASTCSTTTSGPSKTEDLGYLTRREPVSRAALRSVGRGPRVGHRRRPHSARRRRHSARAAGRTACARSTIAGYVSVELMNPQIWRIPPLQFGEVAMTALRKLLGQASME